MTFKKRFLRILYSFAGVACLFLVVVYGYVAGRNRTDETYNLLEQNAMVVSNSFASIIDTSNSAINLVISEPSILTAIRNLSSGKTARLTETEKYYSDEYTLLRERINLYFLYKYCYRVLFYNWSGDVIASNYSTGNNLNVGVDINDVDGVEDLAAGEIVVLPMHDDQWNVRNKQQVISVVKRLAGNNMGYFEVQWLESDVEKLMLPSDNEYQIRVFAESGDVVYSSDETQINDFDLIVDSGKKKGVIRTGNTLLAYVNQDGYYTVISTELSFWETIVFPILPALFLLIVVFLGISIIFANVGAAALGRPISTLQKAITKTDYDNLLRQTIDDDEKADLQKVSEIENTYKIFESMVERLDESKKTAEKMSFLQLRAQLDLMQAQVNPHFIYNVLNIISAKGLMADDESICDMCDNLSKILRYSTNVKEKEATIHEEMEYLHEYLMLLKARYESRLEYHIEVDDKIEDEIIPKLALQQIVENAVIHGFSDTAEVMRIEIQGKQRNTGWEIDIRDNGKGIEQDSLAVMKQRINELKIQLDEGKENVEFEIGGMGIYNTFSRLYLLYRENLVFKIRSDDTGTVVKIGIERRG